MRLARFAALVVPLALGACRRETVDLPSESDAREVLGDSVPGAGGRAGQPAPDADPYAVVPGVRIGRVRVGMPFDSVLVTLGQPAASDAGMETVRGSWRDEAGAWVDVFARATDAAGGYVVTQVNGSGPPFETGATRTEALRLSEGMRPSGPRRVFDSARGLGFEFASGGASARASQVFVVPPGTRDGALAAPVVHNAP